MAYCINWPNRKKKQMLKWLYDCFGKPVWPEGVPRDLKSIHTMVSNSDARAKKRERIRVNEDGSFSEVLMDPEKGFTDAITKLKTQDKDRWARTKFSLDMQTHLKKWLERERAIIYAT